MPGREIAAVKFMGENLKDIKVQQTVTKRLILGREIAGVNFKGKKMRDYKIEQPLKANKGQRKGYVSLGEEQDYGRDISERMETRSQGKIKNRRENGS